MKKRTEKGQASFELLLIFPIFLLFFLLVVDLGIWMYQNVNLANAAREAARYASVHCGNAEPSVCNASMVQTTAIVKSNNTLSPSDFGAGKSEINWIAPASKNSSVVVKLNHNYQMLFFPKTLRITSCADMRLEKDNASATIGTVTC